VSAKISMYNEIRKVIINSFKMVSAGVTNVIVNAYFFAVRGPEFGVSDFGPLVGLPFLQYLFLLKYEL
jgi:hypothetical protein